MATERYISITHPLKIFTFPLLVKDVKLGSIAIQQIWMDQRRIQPDFEATSAYRDIIDFFWATCVAGGETGNLNNRQGYLLMQLLPELRAQGYNNVLAGSKLSLGDRAVAAKNLNRILVQEVRSISVLEFRDATFNVLAGEHSKLEGDLLSLYKSISEELFSVLNLPPTGQSILGPAREILHKLMNRCRHSGNEPLKHVMDIITYEAHAEFSRAYSVVWTDLLFRLSTELSPQSRRFLKIWHTDLSVPSDRDPALFHLFHGKVLALHSCGSILMNSERARAIFGDFLAADEHDCGEEFGRLLWALEVAVHQYMQSRNDQSERRRRGEETAADIDTRSSKTHAPSKLRGQSRRSDEVAASLPDTLEQYASDELITCCHKTMRHLSNTVNAGVSITVIYRCEECNSTQTLTLRPEDLS